MKRLAAILALTLLTPAALLAQEPPTLTPPTANRHLRGAVIPIQHRDADTLASAVKLLGSGAGAISVNEELRTITVRDFPENIAAIEEAVARLDQPLPRRPDLELRISILIGSRTPLEGEAIPATLAGVVKELRSTLAYSHYGLMATTLHRTRGGLVEGSGIAEPTLLGNRATPGMPAVYRYSLYGVSGSADQIGIDKFSFSMSAPLQTPEGSTRYQDVGFQTPVTLRPEERVVIGTSTMGDKALIVVVTATLSGAPR